MASTPGNLVANLTTTLQNLNQKLQGQSGVPLPATQPPQPATPGQAPAKSGFLDDFKDLMESLKKNMSEASKQQSPQLIPTSGFTKQEIDEEVEEKKQAGRKKLLSQIADQQLNPPAPPAPQAPQKTGLEGWLQFGMNAGQSARSGYADTWSADKSIAAGQGRGGIGGNLESAFGRFAKAGEGSAKLNPFGEGVGGAAGEMAGKAMGAANVAMGVVALGKAAYDAVDKLRDWTKGLHQANMQFAEWSASMSSVEAQQEMRDIELSMNKGEARAESAEFLAESMSKLNETLAPMENLFANVLNVVGGSLLRLVEVLIKFGTPLEEIVALLRKIPGIGWEEDDFDTTGKEEGDEKNSIVKTIRKSVIRAGMPSMAVLADIWESYGKPKKFD